MTIRRTPFTPIFDQPIQRGSIDVGSTPGSTIVPTLTLLGSVNDGTALVNPECVTIEGSTAWVGSFSNDYLTSVDISTPATPTVTNNWSDFETDSITALAPFVTGQIVGVSYNTDQLHVYDTSAPATPSEVGEVTSGADMNGPLGVAVGPGFAVVVSDQGREIAYVDLSTPATPSVTGSLNDATNLNGAAGVALTTISSVLYAVVACYSGRITTINLSTPATPTLTGSLLDLSNLGGTSVAMLDASTAVVANGSQLTVVDLGTPATPAILGSATGFSNAVAVVTSGVYALVADSATDSISVVDCTTPASPSTIQTVTDATAFSVTDGLFIDGTIVAAIAPGTSRLATLQFA